MKTEKTCPKCKTTKPLDEYYYEAATGKYSSMCKCCKRACSSRYYELHKAQRAEYAAWYRQTYGR